MNSVNVMVGIVYLGFQCFVPSFLFGSSEAACLNKITCHFISM